MDSAEVNDTGDSQDAQTNGPSVFGPAGPPQGLWEVAQRLSAQSGDTTRGMGTIGEPTTAAGETASEGSASDEFSYSLQEDRTRGFGTVGEPRSLLPQRGEVFGTIPITPIPYRPNMPAKKRKVEWEFGDGLTAQSADGYFSLTFHNLTQVDYRAFYPSGDPLHDSFFIPRQRWYFLGNVSPYIEYYTVINRGYGSLDLLDAFADINTGVIDRDKLKIRVGRMKTPYTYEYIKISETDLIAPERSVFVGNFAPNREEGAMMHGQVIDKRVEYAIGVFNGPRRSFGDYNNSKDLFTFLNTKPFLLSGIDFLEQLNLGGSFNFGNQHNPLQPSNLRTASDQSPSVDANMVSPVFYTFGPNVFESGMRMQWSADLTYYYKSLGVLAGFQGGFQDYGVSPTPIPSNFVGVTSSSQTHVELMGWNVTVSYFLTGEEITRRSFLLEPRHSFDGTWTHGHLGAFEVFSRFANLTMSNNSLALADPGMASSNRANVIDNGFNWYLNHYTKLTLDWQLASYGNPVQIAPGKTTLYNNILWARVQIYF
ncbi:MAG TPA: porin [Pirellulales bacterium]|nr:porin [Pirellulales bacterium]